MLRFRCYIDGKELYGSNAGDIHLAHMLDEFRRFAVGGLEDAKQLNKGHRLVLEWTSDEPEHKSGLE